MAILIEGQHFAKCADGCGRDIVFEKWDEGYPEKQQPSGFLCTCDQWVSNHCGDARDVRCDTCKAYDRAQEFTAIAKSIEDQLQAGDIKRARSNALSVDVVLNDLKTQIDALYARREQAEKPARCAPDCDECRTQGQAAA